MASWRAATTAAGLRVHGATLVPFGGSDAVHGADHGSAVGEAERPRLDAWIRTSGAVDAVFDVDRLVRGATAGGGGATASGLRGRARPG